MSEKLKIKLVRPKDLTAEELGRLFAARDLNMGKVEFPEMLSHVWYGDWKLYTLKGSISGVMVLNAEDNRLNIYYLHGDGLFGNIGPLAERLLDISRKAGLGGLTCYTRDPRGMRLFKMAPGVEVTSEGDRWKLELIDGRK